MKIAHNRADECFEALVEGGIASLEYEITGKTIRLLLVKMPLESHERGVGGRLTDAALDFASKQLLRVTTISTHIGDYLRGERDDF